MKLVFATQNQNKAVEIQKMMPADILVQTLKDLNCHDDIPETADTLDENARLKCRYVHEKFKVACFADDTGLEIEALGGKPGVLSARYAGESKDAKKNMALVLEQMKDKTNRKAQFRTVIALIIDGKEWSFEGVVSGTISQTQKGNEGFGYDPIFTPDGFNKTFAEMTLAEKNQLSHRARALSKMIAFLNQHSISK